MISRRDMLKAAGAAAIASSQAGLAAPGRPNILWISCEDTTPWLGFCGEAYARTPNLDRFAAEGVHYTNAYVTNPVCSPCRFGIITGTYATAMGTQRLRSQFAVPDFVHGFPSYLRRAGYYCTNNVKTDYNNAAERRIIRESWDECSGKAHWRGRRPGQPFFAVFNLTETHQSQAFESAPAKLDPAERHDPSKAPVPPYYPDTAAARATMARVHDCITAMDRRAGAILAELEKEGLAEETIVFFWPDHGQGIPRGKRTLWDTGLKVPLVVRFPEKYRHLAPAGPGKKCERLVSLLDLGPTLLSILGLPIPGHTQGVPFLGAAAGPARKYVLGARDRVDEAMDVSRSARDDRYLYIRNYMPHVSWNAPEHYSDQLDLRREITRLAAEGKLNEAQLTYAGPTKPAEALYDTQTDPWQVKNLSGDPGHRPVLERMRQALRGWQRECRDLGFLHEWQAQRLCEGGRSLWEATREESAYPLQRVLETAELVGMPGTAAESARRLADPDPTVRYWAALGLRAAGRDALPHQDAMRRAMADEMPPVRIEAAGALAAQAGDGPALNLLAQAIRDPDEHAALHAARTLQLLGETARPVLPAMREGAGTAKGTNARWSLEAAVAALGG